MDQKGFSAAGSLFLDSLLRGCGVIFTTDFVRSVGGIIDSLVWVEIGAIL